MEVAQEKLALGVAQVHAVAAAPPPVFAPGAGVGAENLMIAEVAEAVLPDVYEIVFVDVALVVMSTYAVAA